jgi:hypothetical protein
MVLKSLPAGVVKHYVLWIYALTCKDDWELQHVKLVQFLRLIYHSDCGSMASLAHIELAQRRNYILDITDLVSLDLVAQ